MQSRHTLCIEIKTSKPPNSLFWKKDTDEPKSLPLQADTSDLVDPHGQVLAKLKV